MHGNTSHVHSLSIACLAEQAMHGGTCGCAVCCVWLRCFCTGELWCARLFGVLVCGFSASGFCCVDWLGDPPQLGKILTLLPPLLFCLERHLLGLPRVEARPEASHTTFIQARGLLLGEVCRHVFEAGWASMAPVSRVLHQNGRLKGLGHGHTRFVCIILQRLLLAGLWCASMSLATELRGTLFFQGTVLHLRAHCVFLSCQRGD